MTVAHLGRALAFGLIALLACACSSPEGETDRAPARDSPSQLTQAASGPFTWKGFTWTPTSGGMAGVASGDPANVSVDSNGYLHMKIAKNGNTWTAAEVFTTTNLGFGTYQWQIAGPIDRMDHTVVLGLYPYGPAAGIGGDGTNEIDTEFSYWNDELGSDNVDFGVYPATSAGKHWEKDFAFSLKGGNATTARMVWSAKGITGTLLTGFEPIGSSNNVIATYDYAPANPTINVPQQALPLGMNLWCYKGLPSSGQTVEVVLQDFQFVPEGQPITESDAGAADASTGGESDAAPAPNPDPEADAGVDASTPGSPVAGGAIDSGSDAGRHSGGSSATPDGGSESTDNATGCAVRPRGHDDTNVLAIGIAALGVILGMRRRRFAAVTAAAACAALVNVGCGSNDAAAINGGSGDGDAANGDGGASLKRDGGVHGGSDGSVSGDDDDARAPGPNDDAGGVPHDGSTTPDGSGIANGSTILVPAQGALLGHFYGNGTLAATDTRIGRKPAIHLTYYGWDEDWTKNDVPSSDFADGRIPLVNWEPDNINFDDIISGKLDATIQARATGSKALGKKFFLDFAAEMNGDEGWGNNPAKYISAYKHIHDIFTAAGATNVVWAWCPNVTDIEKGAPTMDYYPGDAYVDWTGVDGYNWGTSDANFEWQSFHDVFADIYPKLAAKGKPILIGEMASDEVGGDKGAWIDGIIPALKTDYPLIKAFVWFDIDKERHWEINSSPGALSAYARMAKDPFMNP